MTVIEDDAPSNRRIVFPFFDKTEIAFVILLETLVTGGVLLSGFEHKIGPVVGALIGMYIVGNLTFPSRVVLPKGYEDKIKLAAQQNGYVSKGKDCYVPDLPWFLRWPRNTITVGSNGSLIVRAPDAILRRIVFLLDQS